MESRLSIFCTGGRILGRIGRKKIKNVYFAPKIHLGTIKCFETLVTDVVDIGSKKG